MQNIHQTNSTELFYWRALYIQESGNIKYALWDNKDQVGGLYLELDVEELHRFTSGSNLYKEKTLINAGETHNELCWRRRVFFFSPSNVRYVKTRCWLLLIQSTKYQGFYSPNSRDREVSNNVSDQNHSKNKNKNTLPLKTLNKSLQYFLKLL